jgi:hypothetical protein
MDHVVGQTDFTAVYLDDIYVFSEDWKSHLFHVEEVSKQLARNHIKLKLPKCIFGAPYKKALGHIVGNGEMRPDPKNVAAILALPVPRHVHMVRSVLGAYGYYRGYVDNFASKTAPMTFLTKNCAKGKWEWSEECQKAYDELKRALTSEPILRMPRFDLVFIVTTDWSKLAIGAVLSQVDPDTNFDHPVAYASRLLTSAEQNYSPTEGGCLALVWAVQKYRIYLDGRKFIVYADHAALQWLNTKRHENSKLERWAMQLQEFTYEIRYKKGEENLVADCLSRCVTAAAIFACAANPVWPSNVAKQSDVDSVACVVCGLPHGHDNIAICDGCERCFHLRCLLPPRSVVPAGTTIIIIIRNASHCHKISTTATSPACMALAQYKPCFTLCIINPPAPDLELTDPESDFPTGQDLLHVCFITSWTVTVTILSLRKIIVLILIHSGRFMLVLK